MVDILQVVTDTDRRGAQVFACDLAPALERRGNLVSTVALARGTVAGLELRPLGRRRMSAGTLSELRREAQRHDIVVAHGSSTLPACAIALIGTGVPFVYRQISDSMFWASSVLRRARVRIGLSRAAAVVALWSGSAQTLNESFGVPCQQLSVIPNGVPPDRFPFCDPSKRGTARARFRLQPDRPTAVFVGALVAEKGVDVVIEALCHVPHMQLIVAGDGPERVALERLAEERAPGRVALVGVLEEPAAAYGAADFVVLASRGGDSMPAMLIEAGMMAIPAIATPVEAIPEIVLPGVTGDLVEIGSVTELAAAMERMGTDVARTRQLGLSARDHCVKHYSIDRVAADWDVVVSGVASDRH